MNEPSPRMPEYPIMNKRQPAMFEEPHESYASYLQGLYGPTSYPQMKASQSLRTVGKSMPTPSWPGLTMDSLPILDPKPVFDKSFMENFLSSNNKHFHSDSMDHHHSGSESSSHDHDDSNDAYDDNDSENEESQHHSQRISKPSPQSTNSPRLRSFKSFMPFGFGNFFGSGSSSTSPDSSNKNSGKDHGPSRGGSNKDFDEHFDDEEDSSSHHDSCDSHDSSDSKRHVKFASPEIEIVPSTIKSTSVPISAMMSIPSSVSPSASNETTTKSPDTFSDDSNSDRIKNNISEVSNAM